MKILYVAVDTPIPGSHGGSVHVHELCRALSRRGHDVHVVAPTDASDGSGAEVKAWRDGDVQLHRLRRPPRFFEWTAGRWIRRLAETLVPDVVVERFYTFGGAGVWAAHSLAIPAVLEVNSPARPVPGSWRDRLDRLTVVRPVDRWRRRVLEWSDAIYGTSTHLVPAEARSGLTVVTNGVDIDRFRPGPLRVMPGPLRCVYASSFRSWHGAEELVQAVAICVARGVDVHVTCLGLGPRWAAARNAARRAGLDGTIRFVGLVPFDEVPSHLAAADVGLAPFTPSAFRALRLGWFWSPIKIFEYLAAGLAVVTIDIEELRALLPESVGRFYTPGAPRELADALERLASDRDAVRHLGETARSLAESCYTWGHQAAAVEGVLEQAVAGAASGPR